ncbi:MAG: ATP-binding protein [Verrucomicrobia bacterium]|nr:ATP-binding protein [Verrucomicrobiota bacterium]
MLFLVGPRQAGKTTASLEASTPRPDHFYFNWDAQADRLKILEGPNAIAQVMQLDSLRPSKPIVVFDELHKYSKWKTFIKGFFDKYEKKVQILVTGSARLDIYKAGGDSLMGRYFPYRLHPLSVAEIASPLLRETELAATPHKIKKEDFNALFEFGGFPEPFVKRTSQFYTRWKRLRAQQLFQEDLRDLTRIHELGQIEVLAELLRLQVGQLTQYTELAKKVNVSVDTIRRWIKTLKSFYYCFSIKPWSKNISRSLLKEPKIYLWDWSLIDNLGTRRENFVASHLLKAVHFWTDRGLGDYDLYFLRDKEKREVDFLVTKNNIPWFLVEVKSSENRGISPSLFYYQQATQAPFAFQAVFDKEYVDKSCFTSSQPMIVPVTTLLSQLV